MADQNLQIDEAIDRLYQAPLDEFTAVRNALAKTAGHHAAEIKRLQKPNIAAWAVNQLYWRERVAYQRLIEAAERLRDAHRAVLAGKAADLREAERLHRAALTAALEHARRALDSSGHSASPQTMTAIRETLDALPTSDPPGRLTTPLRRAGFEALAGATIAPTPRSRSIAATPSDGSTGRPPDGSRAKAPSAAERRAADAAERAIAQARERVRFAESTVREAEAAVQRAERAEARAQRDRDRLASELEEADRQLRESRAETRRRQAERQAAMRQRDALEEKLAVLIR